MAGDWIKMRSDLRTHPKVVRVSSALKADRLRVIGALFVAWSVFDAHSVDGTLEGYDADVLDETVGFLGFSRALIAVGWLEERRDGEMQTLVAPRFSEHNGQSAKKRGLDAERKRATRNSAPPVREMSASQADKKRTREEKRREEKEDNTRAHGDLPASVRARDDGAELPNPTPAGDACRAMRQAGVADANPSNPKLLALIDRGVPAAQFADAARRAADKGKGMGYALGIVEGELREALDLASGPAVPTGPWDATRSSIEAKAAEFGLSPWNADDLSPGRESFAAYTERVRNLVAQGEGVAA